MRLASVHCRWRAGLPVTGEAPLHALDRAQEALESPHVSARLHKWIDLVFGRKARGPRAEAAHNVFHYLTYDDVARRFLEAEPDPGMRDALRLQMMEFGRTPRQVRAAAAGAGRGGEPCGGQALGEQGPMAAWLLAAGTAGGAVNASHLSPPP